MGFGVMCGCSIYFWFKKFFPEKTDSKVGSKGREKRTGAEEEKDSNFNHSNTKRDTKVKGRKARNKKRVSDIASSRRRTKGKVKKRPRKIQKSTHTRNAP